MRRELLGGLLCLLACGPKDGSDDEGSATGTAGTVGMSEGTGASGTTGGAGEGETGAPTEGSATGPGATVTEPDATTGGLCEEFADEDAVPAVLIKLRNDSSQAVFLIHVSFCEEVPLFEMAGPDSDAPVKWSHTPCEFTCGEAVGGACGCPAICPEDRVLMIAPGGTHAFSWTGALYSEETLPTQCLAECGDSCLRVRQAPDGVYQLSARGSTSAIVCNDPDVCTCTPNPEGWCDVQASGIGAEVVMAETTVNYPLQPDVVLVFTD